MGQSRSKKALALSFGQGLTTVVAVVTGMVMARLLTMTELAAYRQTLLTYQIAVPFLGLGLSAAIYFYLPDEKKRRRGIVLDAVLLSALMGMLYSLFIVLGGNHLLAQRFDNPAIAQTLLFMIPLPVFALPAVLVSAVLVVSEKITLLSVFNVVSNLALGLTVVVVCWFSKSPEAMIAARVGVLIFSGIIAIGLMFRYAPKDEWRPKLGNMRAMAAYGFPLSIAMAVGTLSLQLDKLIVSVMSTPELFAIYSNGAMEIPIIGIVTGTISTVMIVDFRRSFSARDYVESKRLYHLVPIKTSLFLFPAMAFLAVCAKPFILVLYSEKYVDSTLPFLLYLLIIPSRTILLGGMAALGKGRIILRNSVVLLAINVALSIPLVSYFGYLGAVWGTIIALYIWGIPSALYEVSRSLQCRFIEMYPWRAVGKNLAWSMVPVFPTFVCLQSLQGALPVTQLFVCFGLYSLIYAIILHFREELPWEWVRRWSLR